MKRNTYKLSICMMVKNEEKNLVRCLDSLAVLLGNDSIELIIVDTGSTDATIQIAQKYTEKVYHHPWNNHFSEMRNITISYAKGEWIFILDADEELVEGEKLLALLRLRELDKYNTVQFKMHDYVKSTDDKNYLTYISYRLFRNESTFKYEGAVHNQPNLKPPVMLAPIVLNHYGYQFDNKELLERKFQRTATILKQELLRDPKNLYYRYQLANSYYIHGDLKEALEEIRKSYGILCELPLNARGKYAYIYAEYGRESYANKKFKECIKICSEGLSLKEDYIDLHYYISLAYQAEEDASKAIEHANAHLTLMDKYDQLDITKDPAIIMMCADLFSRNMMQSVLANQYYVIEMFDEALVHALKMVDSKERTHFLINIYFKLDCYKDLRMIYETLDDTLKKAMIDQIEYLRESMTHNQKKSVTQEFASGSDDYAVLNKIRNANGEMSEFLTKEFIRTTDFSDKDIFYAEVFRNFDRDQKEVLAAFKKIKSKKLKIFIKYLLDHYTVLEGSFLTYLKYGVIRDSDYEGNRVYTCIANVLLLNTIEYVKEANSEIEKIHFEIFMKYFEHSINRVNQIYRMDRMKLNYSTLDQEEDKFIILLYLAKEAVEKGNYKSGIKYFKEAVEEYPYLTLVLNTFRDQFLSSIEVEVNKTNGFEFI